MGLLDGLGQALSGVLHLDPAKAVEGVGNMVTAPLQAAQSLLMGSSSQSLGGGTGGLPPSVASDMTGPI
ncbi:hypothetical protein LJR230_004091 [Trinickia sp. LjRoot230]|uniref:hypothetical protein n=1 Tax=Trinickia sp. LjRoot230 TaxID=3342288 RepID=UPI003ECD33CB